MIEEKEVIDRLTRLLRDEMSLERFEAWLVSESWNMHRDSSLAARRLVGSIELRLAEHSSGDLSTEAMHGELASILNRAIGNRVVVLQVDDGASPPRRIRSASTLRRWKLKDPSEAYALVSPSGFISSWSGTRVSSSPSQ